MENFIYLRGDHFDSLHCPWHKLLFYRQAVYGKRGNRSDAENAQPVLFGWGSGDPSELNYLYSSEVIGVGVPWNNAGHYKNGKVDEYINKA
ncbi:MAG: hypothetical protein RSC76_02730, partial [Oscillospiraceae bacterium]